MNDDCLVEFSECTALDPAASQFTFTCQCEHYYFEKDEFCVPGAYTCIFTAHSQTIVYNPAVNINNIVSLVTI